MRIARRLIAALIACAVLGGASFSDARAALVPGPLGDLQLQLATMSLSAPGHVGVLVEDLATGLSTGINSGADMPAASTIKIPVMVEVFKQMAAGRFDLNKQIALRSGDRDDGWGDLDAARSGSKYSVSRLLWLMITDSDNTATNMLIRLVGRSNINTTMGTLGLTQTRVADYIRSEGDIRSLRSSPRDMVRLLGAMARDRLVDQWSSREMVQILGGQRHNGLLPQPLPPGTQVAHKTGTLHDTLNDVGIVYLGTDPYIIAVMTTSLPSLDAGRRFIRGVSRVAYNQLERFANWREANALPAIEDAAAAPLAPDVQMWTPQSSAAAAETTAPGPGSSPAP
ncbi:MAG: hypothetical protein NVSMB64_22530 [Candidatus Velthaea sp.]